MTGKIVFALCLLILLTGCRETNIRVFDQSTHVFKKYIVSDVQKEYKETPIVKKEISKKIEAEQDIVKSKLKGGNAFIWKTKYMEIEMILHKDGTYSSKNKAHDLQDLQLNGTWSIKNGVLKLTSAEGAASLFNEPTVGDSFSGIYGTHGVLLRVY